MVAAPQYATLTFIGMISGQTYTKDMYASDVVAAAVNLDGGAGASATSPADMNITGEAMILRDLSIKTGMTDTTKLQLVRNQVPTGDILRWANHLNTLNNRPVLNLPFLVGDKLAGLQLA